MCAMSRPRLDLGPISPNVHETQRLADSSALRTRQCGMRLRSPRLTSITGAQHYMAINSSLSDTSVRPLPRPRPVGLALQVGDSWGAYTWGALSAQTV